MIVPITFTIFGVLVSVPHATAHMALWSPSVYGFGPGGETPLTGMPFSQWWFRGHTADKPKEVMTITAGKPLTVEISCRYEHSSWGDKASSDACPVDPGAYHAGAKSFVGTNWEGDGGNTEADLMGCALAIAPKANAASTNPEDFVVMSVLERCVRQRDTTFEIPANLPACPDGECTCAWFWEGKMAQDEMCNVVGGAATAWPKPVAPKRGAISGPTQPAYWANDHVNIDYAPDMDTRPRYNSQFGWRNGAQTEAFSGGGAVAAPAPEAEDDPVPVATGEGGGGGAVVTPVVAAPVTPTTTVNAGRTRGGGRGRWRTRAVSD